MGLVLYNPHVDDFLGEPPHFRLAGRRALRKYGFMIEGSSLDRPLHVVVDGTLSCFIPIEIFAKLGRRIRMRVAEREFASWVRLNGLEGSVEIVTPSSADLSRSVLLVFSYKAMADELFDERRRIFDEAGCTVAHLSHYFIDTARKAVNMRSCRRLLLAGDSDITDNPYYRSHFGWYESVLLVLPFAVSDRFRSATPFDKRSNLCVATGTFHDLTRERPARKYSDYRSLVGIDTYHPLRAEIWDERDNIGDEIRCLISPFRMRRFRHVAPVLDRVLVAQRKHFSIDLVQEYDEAKMAVVGEEASGFPALGSLEAMACGTLVLGRYDAFEGLGLIEGRHYLGHDGTLTGLLDARARVLALEDEGEGIAEAGMREIDARFRGSVVRDRWLASAELALGAAP